jgi:hypothetical protein
VAHLGLIEGLLNEPEKPRILRQFGVLYTEMAISHSLVSETADLIDCSNQKAEKQPFTRRLSCNGRFTSVSPVRVGIRRNLPKSMQPPARRNRFPCWRCAKPTQFSRNHASKSAPGSSCRELVGLLSLYTLALNDCELGEICVFENNIC